MKNSEEMVRELLESASNLSLYSSGGESSFEDVYNRFTRAREAVVGQLDLSDSVEKVRGDLEETMLENAFWTQKNEQLRRFLDTVPNVLPGSPYLVDEAIAQISRAHVTVRLLRDRLDMIQSELQKAIGHCTAEISGSSAVEVARRWREYESQGKGVEQKG
jgi:hypothetical protein